LRATVQRWSGREVRALREAKRMSIREFAKHLGVTDRMVSKWEAGARNIHPRPVNQEALDTSLARCSDDVQARFAMLIGGENGGGSRPLPTDHADVTAVFPSRSEFIAAVSPVDLFDEATRIRAAGLSLNLLCQLYADRRLDAIVRQGTRVQGLFLDPRGKAIADREREERLPAGTLSTLTEVNMALLVRVRDGLPDDVRHHIGVAVYDEPIRFNITLIDERLCVAQPYLPALRGIDSPTLIIENRHDRPGLFATFERMFDWLVERSSPW
jgi:transcriptional regulator with XRE-family HTH domain